MSETGLTSNNSRQKHAVEITQSATFKTHGVIRLAAENYLETEAGMLYERRLVEADSRSSLLEIRERALDHLMSGRELPRMELLDTHDSLVKIVPAGTSPSRYSPFWVKEAELDAAIKAGKNLSDHFGLPIVSEAPRYDVYRITYRPTRRSMTVPWHHAR